MGPSLSPPRERETNRPYRTQADGRSAVTAVTPLAQRLAARIDRRGAITVAEFMAAALTDPDHGYYMTGDPLGVAGDFTTAPEISQTFGELIGLWCADGWQALGAPSEIALVELGPGRGTLMADALRAARLAPGFLDAIRLHLVEVSPALRGRQEAALAAAPLAEPPRWHAHFGQVPEGPVLLLANEVFDALPIRQFERSPRGWCERLVRRDETGEGFAFALAPLGPAASALIPPALRAAPQDTVAEICPAGLALAAEIGRRLAHHGGAALVIDYGSDRPSGRPTLQALRRHRPQPVLEAPGSADLTAHVDFAALVQAARTAGAAAHGPVTQGAFLAALGIAERAAALTKGATSAQSSDIAAAVKRLTDPAEMGALFKVLALTGPAARPPAGFPAAPTAAGV